MKLKTATTPAWEFYDLTSDPHENHNEYNNPKYRDIINRLKAEMLELRAEVKDTDSNRPEMKEIMQSYY